jgi:predicted dehydrogenase
MAKSAKKHSGTVRWGIISTAAIGVEKVIPGMLKSKKFEVRAIASRELATAKKWAKKLGIPVAYGSYEELLDDPEIDVVYNPLPNHLHVPLTLKAAKKGKHVLCEKPIALSADEAETLKSAPKSELIAKGKLGTLRAVQVFFSYYNEDPNNVRNMADIGGGGAYDIGCYAILSGRYLFDAEPAAVVSLIDRDPVFHTDRTTSALVDFGEGRHLTFTVGTQIVPYQRVNVLGTKGRIEIEIPFNAPQGGAMRIYLDNGKKLGDASAKTIKLGKADQYQLEAEAFTRAVQGKEPLEFGLDDAIRQMRVIDAVFRSEKSRSWEKV